MVTRRRRLLLADDSLTIQKVVSLTFSDEGIDVIAVSDGEQAMRRLEEDAPPDIVLADVFMPPPSGYELCERIKGDPRFRRIPVLLLIGTFEPFNEAEARRVGADDVLTKPFQSIRELVNKVGSLLGGGRSEDDEPDTRDLTPPASATQTSTASREDVRAQSETGVAANARGDASREDADSRTPTAAQVSFADIEMDDQMIEAKPLEASTLDEAPVQGEVNMRSETAARQEEMPARQASPSFTPQGGMTAEWESLMRNAQSSLKAQAPVATATAATTADDSLLELDNIGAPATQPAADDDDFILDLADEDDDSAPASHEASFSNIFDETPAETHAQAQPHAFPEESSTQFQTRADASGSLAEAAHGEREVTHFGAWDDNDDMPTIIAAAPSGSVEERRDEEQFETETGETAQAYSVPSWPHEEGEQTSPQRTAETAGLHHSAEDFRAAQEEFRSHQEEFRAPQADERSASAGARSIDEMNASRDYSETATIDNETETVAAQAATGAASASSSSGQQISLEQLSPEVIDAIARRAVEHLSERVVEQIAWEVVPQLAELLIKRRLEEERK